MKLSDYVMERVAQAGVRHVFLVPGGGCMHLVDSLGRHPDLAFIANLHEQGAAVAADAYAQASGGLGVALVTTGPGGTNALTGVAASYLDSIPVLVLSGQVKRADCAGPRGVRQMGFQELDIVSMARPITKYRGGGGGTVLHPPPPGPGPALRLDGPQRPRLARSPPGRPGRGGGPGDHGRLPPRAGARP